MRLRQQLTDYRQQLAELRGTSSVGSRASLTLTTVAGESLVDADV